MNRFVLIAPFLLGLALSCGPTKKADPCGPGICQGCCAEGGVCMPGTDNDACGKGGAKCSSCEAIEAGRTCEESACTSKPSCAGCRDVQGTCVAGTSDLACGAKGAACVPCTNGRSCISRSCQKTCKEISAACASDYDCCSGRCGTFAVCIDGPGLETLDGGGGGGTPDGGPPLPPECSEQLDPLPVGHSPCTTAICMYYPACCNDVWDDGCATVARNFCAECGATFDAGP